MQHSPLCLAILLAISGQAVANNESPDKPDDSMVNIERMTIIGSRDQVRKMTGSAHFIGPEQLEKFAYSDIQRIAREVPGVSIQVEDGYGLRPNISIRGVATERSSRITLLEDNVLIAPAPYSAPSAYYFPTVGRMYAFEVLKGPAAITQGPYTIGGALNMVSTPIPDEYAGDLLFEAGQNNTYRTHATYGGRGNNGFGFMLETHQWRSDGFQEIDRGGSDTGLDIEDYTVKLGYAPEDSPHSVELKLQYADQDSEQSYLGLTDADFSSDTYRRYGLSVLDNISTRHEQVILRYQYALSKTSSISATLYHNDHQRNWFKTEGLDIDGSASAQDFDRTSWFNIIQGINQGSGATFTDNNGDSMTVDAATLQRILDGEADTAPGSIQLRSNAREYFSRGIQLGLHWTIANNGVSHDLEVGVRYHEDEEDRLQRNSTYSQQGGALVRDDLGELGNAGNRIQEAEALAIHLYDHIEFGDWVLTPGLRYEDIDQSRTRYRDGAQRTFRDSRENDTSVLLPGLGAIYKIDEQLSLLGGVHKGFTAPSNSPGVDEEEALNYELGLRYQGNTMQTEVIAFLSDYQNLLGECTSSSGSDCEVGEAFNGDAATVQGIELLLTSNLASNGSSLSIPLIFNYTYIDGEFDTDIADTDFFGDVSKGDPIPYIPEHQFQLSLGLVQDRWGLYLNTSYVDEVCVRASCGAFEKTDSSLTVDLSGNYQLNDQVNLFARFENLTDEQDILGRHPYGARPNMERTATIGVKFSF